MTYQTLLVEKESSGILLVKLNRPDALNALSFEMLNELEHMIEAAHIDPQVRGILLTGEGAKSFCAGADIKGLLALNQTSGESFAKLGQSIFRRIEQSAKPVVAAINGFCFGGGCELAMSTHVRFASSNAQFGQPEVKLGVIPGYGGTQRLSRLVGKGRAIDLCLSGRFINAETALQWGLVTQVTPQETLLDESKKYLMTLINMAPVALHKTLQSIDVGFDIPLDEALALEAALFGECCETADKIEGVNAFLEKRKPVFQGK